VSYELWDVQTGNGLAQFGTAREMADFVDRLLEANGKSWAVHLSLVIEEATGDQSGLLTGSDLLAWTWGVLHASPDAIRIPA
jgi:hypothetical protein